MVINASNCGLHFYITIYLTGVPSLKRTELEAACEDFSNVIGTSSMGTVYKGTLSTGVEIAVTSLAVESAKEWPEILEAQFRKKVHKLILVIISFHHEINFHVFNMV